MARPVLLVVIGALLGGAGAYLISAPSPEPNTSISLVAAETTAEDGARTVLPSTPNQAVVAVSGSGSAATRLRLYERAKQAADALDLEAMLDSAVVGPPSRSRDLEISVLLARLAELDPHRAVEYAQAASLDTKFLVQAYVALARAGIELALSDLRSVTPPAKRQRVAVALLDIVGNDASGVERIAQALPASQRASFEVDALLGRAEADPTRVFASALEHDRLTLETYLLPRLAAIAAQRDPLAGLEFGESIADSSLRSTFQSALLNAWAEVDPASVFEWLGAADHSVPSSAVVGALPALANEDPERLLAMVDLLPFSVRRLAQGAVMTVSAERDPVAAIAMLESMPAGRAREPLLQTIAQNYGRQNPGQALDWARSLTPASPLAVQAVLQGIAAVDADRAIEAFIAELDRPGAGAPAAPNAAALRMMSTLVSSGADVGRLAARLLESNDGNTRSLLSTTLSSWASRDIDAALYWTLANASHLDASAVRGIARQFGYMNFDLAVSTLSRLPPAAREGWFQALVDQKLATGTEAALTFINAYPSEPGFGEALGYVAQRMARSDPARAASILTESGNSQAMRRSRMVASEWARRDPGAAARWALEGIADVEAQTTALNAVASAWAQSDTVAAERWLFTLESGIRRDAAADGLMFAAAQAGRFEPRILDVYSSESSRQQATSRAIVILGRTDPVRARELMDAHLPDPVIRMQTEENIARTSAVRSAPPIARGIIQ